MAASLLVAAAAWSELAPPATSAETFLTEDVAAGTRLEPGHVEVRRVPSGTLRTVEPAGVAVTDLRAGDPLVESMISEVVPPPGWVVIEAPVPSHARPGAQATAIVLEDGAAPIEFPARVMHRAEQDPLGGGSGTLAVPADWLGSAAAASAEGRLVIGVEGPSR